MGSIEVVRNRQVVMKDHVFGFPKESDMYITFTRMRLKIPENRKGVVLVKNLYFACDPYMRIRMGNHQDREFGNFIPGFPINGFGVAKVLDSTHLSFKEGDLVWGTTGWEEYSIITTPERLFKIHYTDLPCSYHWNMVELLKNRLGFDGAFNYKEEPDLNAALKRFFPEGIDIYFENAGGKLLDAVLQNMRVNGRIAVSGLLSQYNLEQPDGIQNLMYLVFRRIRMQGFAVFDYCSMYPKFLDMVLPYVREEKLVYVEDITEGILHGPAALLGIFTGQSFG
ncbi:hypothetical protein QYF36_026841 [Acer negundo]|nr:hypothetical protein QYF36_026841 [Acer negundo]